MAETDHIVELEGDGSGLQCVIQGEDIGDGTLTQEDIGDGTQQPVSVDPSESEMTTHIDVQAQFVNQETDNVYIPGSDEQSVQYITTDGLPIAVNGDEQSQYVISDGYIQDSNSNDVSQVDSISQVDYQNAADSLEVEANPGVQAPAQIQYVTEDGTPIDPSLVNPDGTLCDGYTTTADQMISDTQPDASTVQYITADGQPVLPSIEDEQLQSSIALPEGTISPNDEMITSITPHVPETISNEPALCPNDQIASEDDVQYIMDPHTGTIYTLKGGKATVLTTEANIIMNDPNALDLPTQTAKVLPDSMLNSNVPGSIDVANSDTNIMDSHSKVNSPLMHKEETTATDATVLQISENKEVPAAAAAEPLSEPSSTGKPTSPNPMKPPTGDITKLPDVVFSTVSSEDTTTNETVSNSLSPAQTSTAAVPSDALQKIPQMAPQNPPQVPKSPAVQKTVFKCELCEFRSTKKPEVYQHLLATHTPSKMMMCVKCKKGFKSKALCDAHQAECGKSQQQIHRCSHCSFTSMSKEHVDSHIKDRHTPKPALQCDLCSYASTYEFELTEHIESKHPETIVDISADEKEEKAVIKKDIPKMTPMSSPVRDSAASHILISPASQTKNLGSKAPSANRHLMPVKSGPASSSEMVQVASTKRGMLVKQPRKQAQVVKKDLSDIELEDGKNKQKKIKKRLSSESDSPSSLENSENDIVTEQKDVKEHDPRLQVQPKVCLLKIENFIEITEAVQLITQKKLKVTRTIVDALGKKPHSHEHYANITKKIIKSPTYLLQKRDNRGKFLQIRKAPISSEQIHKLGRNTEEAKVSVMEKSEEQKKCIVPKKTDERKKEMVVKRRYNQGGDKKKTQINIAAKMKSTQHKPSIMDKFFDDTREDYEERMGHNESEGGRSKRKRKPKVFGTDFVNSEYLTASGVFSDVASSSTSASVDLNLSDSTLDEEMEEEEENPLRKKYKRHPGSGLEKEHKQRRKSGGSSKSNKYDEFGSKDMSDFEEELPKPKKKKRYNGEELSLSETDEEFEDIPRRAKKSKYDEDKDFTVPASVLKKSFKPKHGLEEEEDEELEKLDAVLAHGKKMARIAHDVIDESALQESPVKKSLFLGETLHREPKGRGRGRKRKTSIDAPAKKQRKISIERIRKPIGLDKINRPLESGEEIEENVMVKYSEDDEETGEDEDSRETMLRQYAAAVKVTPNDTSDGEDDPAKRKRKKKTYGEDFVIQPKKHTPKPQAEGIVAKKRGRPPKMKHTGSINNPKRGPPQPKYSIPTPQDSATPPPIVVGQRRVDGMPSPNSLQNQKTSLPWVGKLSNILTQVQKTSGEDPSEIQSVVKSTTQSQGQLGGVKYSLVDKDGKLVMIPLSASPKKPVSPTATVATKNQSILKIVRSSAPSTVTTTVNGTPANPKVVFANKPGTVTKFPAGTKIIKMNGKTYICKSSPKSGTVVSSSPQGNIQKIIMSPRSAADSTKIIGVNSGKTSSVTSIANPVSSVIQASASTSTDSSKVTAVSGAGNVPRIIKVSNSPKIVCLPPGSKNLQVVQSSAPVQRIRPKKVITQSHEVYTQPMSSLLVKPLPQITKTMTLFPSTENPQLPAHVVTSRNTETVLESEIEPMPATVFPSSGDAESTTVESGEVGAVELDPQDLLQNMAVSGNEDIGLEMNQLPGFDSSDMLDPNMQEMLNLL